MDATREFRYVLLCRHARHDDGWLVPFKNDNDDWRFPTESVARVLAEELVIGGDRLRLGKVVYAPTPEASRTASLLLRRLQGGTSNADGRVPEQPDRLSGSGKVKLAAPSWLPGPDKEEQIQGGACGYDVSYQPWDVLLPHRLYPISKAARCVDLAVKRLRGGANAVLVVGHQPQMGCLSSHLSGHRPGWRNRAVPLAASEVVCLRLEKTRDGSWRGPLCWTLVPDDRNALDAVSDKVKGKMESAKLLSAVITLALTALLGVLLDTNRWTGLGTPKASLAGLSYSGQAAIQVAFVLLLTALALYLLTMYSYDRLLMPPRFWAEGPDRRRDAQANTTKRRKVRERLINRRVQGSWLPRRPPSSSAWVVFRNMQRIWFWLFTPANILVGLALAILAAALLRLQGWTWLPVALFVLVTGAWGWWFRPVLGSED